MMSPETPVIENNIERASSQSYIHERFRHCSGETPKEFQMFDTFKDNLRKESDQQRSACLAEINNTTIHQEFDPTIQCNAVN